MIALPQQEEVAIWRIGQTNTEREICLFSYIRHIKTIINHHHRNAVWGECCSWANSTHSGHLSLQKSFDIFFLGISLVVVVGWAAMTNENSNHLSISFSRIVFPTAVMPWMSLCSGRRGIPGAINFPSTVPIRWPWPKRPRDRLLWTSLYILLLRLITRLITALESISPIYDGKKKWKMEKLGERKEMNFPGLACVPVWREKGWMEFW